MKKPYYYTEGTDEVGCTFDIFDAYNERLVSAHYWERCEDLFLERREEAEANAKLIVDALNAYQPPEQPGVPKWLKGIVHEHDKSVGLPTGSK